MCKYLIKNLIKQKFSKNKRQIRFRTCILQSKHGDLMLPHHGSARLPVTHLALTIPMHPDDLTMKSKHVAQTSGYNSSIIDNNIPGVPTVRDPGNTPIKLFSF